MHIPFIVMGHRMWQARLGDLTHCRQLMKDIIVDQPTLLVLSFPLVSQFYSPFVKPTLLVLSFPLVKPVLLAFC